MSTRSVFTVSALCATLFFSTQVFSGEQGQSASHTLSKGGVSTPVSVRESKAVSTVQAKVAPVSTTEPQPSVDTSEKVKKATKARAKRKKARRHHARHATSRQPARITYLPRHRELVGDQNYQGNFLVGGEIGYARQEIKDFVTRLNANSPAPFGFVTPLSVRRETMSNGGGLLGLLAGWQYRCERALFGAEASVDFQTFDQPRPFMFTDSNNFSYSATAYYDRGPLFALTGRAGWFVTSGFLPYVRLGAQVSRDKVNFQVFPFSSVMPMGALKDFSSARHSQYGVVAGLGIELPALIGASTVRVEYVFSKTETATIIDTQGPIYGKHTFKRPEVNALKVAWVWNFL